MNIFKEIDLELEASRIRNDTSGYLQNKIKRINFSPFDKYRLKLILKIMKGKFLGNTAELGSGICLAAESYKPDASGVVFCDIDAFSLKAARLLHNSETAGRGIGFVTADLRNLPFKDSFFDSIICLEALEHVDKGMHRQVLGEILRVSKNRARVYLSTPNRFSLPGLEGKVMEIFIKGYKWDAWDKTHKYIYSYGELMEFVKSFPFEIESATGFYYLPGSTLTRLPLALQQILGYASYLLSRYIGKFFIFRNFGFNIILELRKLK